MEELRCGYKKYGELFLEDAVLEVKCNSRYCGAGPGIVVIHGFDVKSGKLLGTERFAVPRVTDGKEGMNHGARDHAAVRSA